MNGTGIDARATFPAAAAPVVAVTGAHGFIGAHVVRALRNAGYSVRPITRSAGKGEVLHPGIDADADWHPVLAGVDSVVHLAGMAHMPLQTRAMRRRLRAINVQSTQRLAQSAAATGITTFVFMSSIKAVADHSEGTALTESSPPRPEDCYGMAKLAAERRLQRIGRHASSTRFLILRPPLVYGPGVGANFAAFARLVGRGLPLPLAGIRNRRSLIYVGNLAAAVVRCLQMRGVPGGTFHLSDGVAVSTPELARAIAAAQNRTARLLNLPVNWLRLGAMAAGRQEQFSRLAGSLEVSNRHFCRSFGWSPPFTLEQGLSATLGARGALRVAQDGRE